MEGPSIKNFNFDILHDPEFKEDSVREEIVSPVLRDLGYGLGQYPKIIRGRKLVHPFVMIGSSKRKINIVPDYILEINEKCKVVIDAKSPTEEISNSIHVEQVYSYAIHPEVRAVIYGLCNGHEWVFWDLFNFEPILKITSRELSKDFKKIADILSPINVEKPEKRDFLPDYGLHMRKMGANPDMSYTFVHNSISSMAKVEDDLYASTLEVEWGNKKFALTLDFNKEQYLIFLDYCTKDVRGMICEALSRQPYSIDSFPPTDVLVSGRLGLLTTGIYEAFVPLIVEKVSPALEFEE